MTRVFFLSLLSRNFDDQLSSNFHRFVILCICWDTPSEKTGLWQLPIVSSVFKGNIYHWFFGIVQLFQSYINVDIYNKTNLWNFLTKVGCVFEISLKIWSGYVHARSFFLSEYITVAWFTCIYPSYFWMSLSCHLIPIDFLVFIIGTGTITNFSFNFGFYPNTGVF